MSSPMGRPQAARRAPSSQDDRASGAGMKALHGAGVAAARRCHDRVFKGAVRVLNEGPLHVRNVAPPIQSDEGSLLCLYVRVAQRSQVGIHPGTTPVDGGIEAAGIRLEM